MVKPHLPRTQLLIGEFAQSNAYTASVAKGLLGIRSSIKRIDETALNIRKDANRIKKYVHLPDGTIQYIGDDCIHHVITVEFKDGSKFILDSAGARYGQPHATVPYDEYMRAYAPAQGKKVLDEQPDGSTAAALRGRLQTAIASSPPNCGPHVKNGNLIICDVMARGMNICAAMQEGGNKMEIHEVLRFKAANFENAKAAFMHNIRMFMQEWMIDCRRLIAARFRPQSDVSKPDASLGGAQAVDENLGKGPGTVEEVKAALQSMGKSIEEIFLEMPSSDGGSKERRERLEILGKLGKLYDSY
jgi:hypothetical protein